MRVQGGRVEDQLDVPLEDSDLLDEVELTTNLMIAATQSDAHLSQEEVDRLLGIAGRGDGSGLPAHQGHERGS